jgi:hypothetical protein
MTGTDNVSADETIGTFTTSVTGVGVPVGAAAPATFTAATVNGTPIGTQSPFPVLLTDGCNVVLRPSPIDAATHASFKVFAPPVHITSLNPTTAQTGKNVEIDGEGFNGTSTVRFGAVPATQVTHDSATMLHATVPSAAITGPVIVENTAAPRGRFTSACTFTVLPKITSFTPHSGITGSVVTINGSGLTPGTQVIFASAAAGKILSRSANQLRVRVSDGAVRGPVRLETAAGSATTSTDFVPTLSLTSFAPASGPAGTSVSIVGIGFNSSSTVKFHGVPATSVMHVSSTMLIAVVPFAQTGPITVTNTTAPAGTVKSFKSFLRTS